MNLKTVCRHKGIGRTNMSNKMKKLFFTFILTLTLVVSVYAFTEGKTLKDVGIPYHVSHIEFWNGGSKIATFDNAIVEIIVQTNNSLVTLTGDKNNIQFYIYKITCNGKIVKIIDSEALAILFTE